MADIELTFGTVAASKGASEDTEMLDVIDRLAETPTEPGELPSVTVTFPTEKAARSFRDRAQAAARVRDAGIRKRQWDVDEKTGGTTVTLALGSRIIRRNKDDVEE